MQLSHHFVRVGWLSLWCDLWDHPPNFALAVVRNKFWDPSGNLLGTLCMYDRSSCGAVLMLAASLRFWYRDLLNSFEELARVSWRSLAGP